MLLSPNPHASSSGALPCAEMITRYALCAGVAVPFFYYGSQAAAAPFFPGFSFLGTTASELGSDLSRHPVYSTTGPSCRGSPPRRLGRLRRRLRGLGVHPLLAWLTSLAVALGGCGSLWAGYYPLPDPRHGGYPAFLIALLSLPVLLAIVLCQGHISVYVSIWSPTWYSWPQWSQS